MVILHLFFFFELKTLFWIASEHVQVVFLRYTLEAVLNEGNERLEPNRKDIETSRTGTIVRSCFTRKKCDKGLMKGLYEFLWIKEKQDQVSWIVFKNHDYYFQIVQMNSIKILKFTIVYVTWNIW